MQALILAGGLGTRLRPYTFTFPKPLMPVSGMPILEIIIRQLTYYGFSRVTISTGYLSDLIKSYFGNGHKYGLSIDYLHEDKPLNTAGPIKLFQSYAENFLVINGDVLTDLDFSELAHFHSQQQPSVSVVVKKRFEKTELGVLKLSPEGDVTDYIEKPVREYMVSSGIYFVNNKVKSYINEGESIGFPTLIMRLIEEQERVCSYDVDPSWLDIGRLDDYEMAQVQFQEHRSEFLPGELQPVNV